jgi:predicted ATPase
MANETATTALRAPRSRARSGPAGHGPLLQRVVLQNYKSIAACDVRLRPVTFLVGPNGSGKSNFVDALRFVKDALVISLDHAIRRRGGLDEVRRRLSRRPRHFGFRLEFALPLGQQGHYAFRIGSEAHGGYEVQQEQCRVVPADGPPASFDVHGGEARSSVGIGGPFSTDRLVLPLMASVPPFRPVHDALSRMAFYNLNPDRMRDLQTPDPGVALARDGSNIASVLAEIGQRQPATKQRIETYLSKIVPGIKSVESQSIGSKEAIAFRQVSVGANGAYRFTAEGMSDGTLRALGILVALFQSRRTASPGGGRLPSVTLVAIEEPEAALHPAAAGILFDSIKDASASTQVLVTSHSPDLLDHEGLNSDLILAVTAEGGTTVIAPLDEVGQSVLRDQLYTAGELLRLDQLRPDRRVAAAGTTETPLFDR